MKRAIKKIIYCSWCLVLAGSFLLTTTAQAVVNGKRINSQTAGVKNTTPPNSTNSKSEELQKPKYAPGELIVKFRPAVEEDLETAVEKGRVSIASIDKLNKKHKVKKAKGVFVERRGKKTGQARSEFAAKSKNREKKFPGRAKKTPKNVQAPDLTNTYRIDVADANADIEEIAREYAKDPNVEYAQPNYIYETEMIPNDPYYASANSWGQGYDDMWGLKNIKAAEAWDISQGEGVVVAVVDSGVDYNHPDLKSNMWTNPGEIPDNGIDDDGNGFVDDIYGYNFQGKTNDPMDDHGHGTHCAGTIAAVGNNNLGVIGVAPKARVMAVKGLSASGSGTTADLTNGIRYAADMGADVISNSWGSRSRRPSDPVSEEAVDYAYAKGCVVVFAAGNSNDDVAYYSPSNSPNVISVASTDQNDIKSDFSNYGQLISVSAPGGGSADADGSNGPATYKMARDILSLRANATDMYAAGDNGAGLPSGICVVNSNYYRSRGTSMACPHVAGLAALVVSKFPNISNAEVAARIMGTADNNSDPAVAGRINAQNALVQDSKPHIKPVDVIVAELIGDGDQSLDPGEKVKLTVNLKNYWKDAAGVSATLAINSPYISSVDQAYSNFGSIKQGGIASNSTNPFIFTVSPSCPFPLTFSFSLNITAGSYAVTRTIDLRVGDPAERAIAAGSGDQRNPSISGDRIVWHDSRNGNNDIYLYDLGTNTERRITTNADDQRYPSISGDKIVWQDFRNGNYDIYLYDLSTSTERQITTNTASQRFPIISGNRIVWEDERNGDPSMNFDSNWDIYLYDLSTNTERQITTNTARQATPDISNDRIVWEDMRNGNSDVYMYDLKTNTERQITTDLDTQSYPGISGDRIVWQDVRENGQGIYLYDLNVGVEQRIYGGDGFGAQADVRISGNQIVWSNLGVTTRNWDIYYYDLSTKTVRQITSDLKTQTYAEVSNDRIVWQDFRNSNYDIYAYDLNPAPFGSISINGSSVYTKTTLVTLTLSAMNPGGSVVTKMQFSNDNVNWSAPEAYATTKSWNLATLDGPKTVYAKFMSAGGKWSKVAVSNTVILDTVPPTMTIASPVSGAKLPTNAPLIVTGTASDSSGLNFVYVYVYDITNNKKKLLSSPVFLYDGINWSTGNNKTSENVTVDSVVLADKLIAGHTIGIAVFPKDNAGNEGAVQSMEVVVNTPPASIPVSAQVATAGQVVTFYVRATDVDGDKLTFNSSNIPTGASLTTVLSGDFDRNGLVDLNDYTLWRIAYNSTKGQPKYNPKVDIDNDGVIGITEYYAWRIQYRKDINTPGALFVGYFSWTLGAGQAGTYNPAFTVSDGKGGTAQTTVNVTVQ